MRARRAERCLQRAAAAIESGSLSEACDALDEARQLSPTDPRIDHLQARLPSLEQVALAGSTDLEPEAVVEPGPFGEPPLTSGVAAIAPAFLSELVVNEAAIEVDSTPGPDTVVSAEVIEPEIIEPEIIEPVLVGRQPHREEMTPGAFEPVLDVDRMRTPAVEGWGGLALAPAPRESTRASSVLMLGLLLSSLAAWQAWEHKDRWMSFVPSARPDIDATTGLTADVSRAEPLDPPIVKKAPSSATVPPSEPNLEPVSSEAAQPHEDTVPDSAPLTSGTSGNGVTARSGLPQSAELTTAAARREAEAAASTEASSSAPTNLSTRQPELPNVASPTESRPSTPVTSTTTPTATPPAPAAATPVASSSEVSTPPVVVAPDPGPLNAGAIRNEPSPSLASPLPASAPAPSPTAPPAASSTPVSRAVTDQSAAVRATLARYETGFSRLDVGAVQSVWPSLDQHALSRAFDGLASQRVSLGACNVNVKGSTARADCSGTAAWTPKIGGGERIASRKWTFDLSESDAGWRIVRVQAR